MASLQAPGISSLSVAVGHLKQAIDADRAGNIKSAIELYQKSYNLIKNAIELGLPSQYEANARNKIQNTEARIRELAPLLNSQSQPQATAPTRTASNRPIPQRGTPTSEPSGAGGGGMMTSAILKERPDVKFDDVAGLKAAKQSLYEAAIMPIKFPGIFKGPIVPWKGILLYGPPGTGKSFLAKAVAEEANQSTFLTVCISELTSKWLGESAKLIKALFQTARAMKPSVVFIDEIDSLVSERGEQDSESGRRMKTEFLLQMDGVGSDNRSVIIIAATNLPWSLDPAIRRRFEKRIYVPLPDKEARLQLFHNKLKGAYVQLTSRDIESMANSTNGFSGADIEILVRDALMQPIREFQQSEYFHKIHAIDTKGVERDGVWAACGRFSSGSVKTQWDKLDPNSLAQPIATFAHFQASIQKVKPSVSKADLVKYEKWTKEFGEDGS